MKCKVEWCTKTATAAGRCKNHYYQLRNRASLAKAMKDWPVSARIGWFTGPREANGCRLWLGRTNDDGYPEVYVNKRRRLVGRVILGLEFGDPRVSRHSCDTPQCVEPGHLAAGTPKQNSQDREQRGRANRRTKFSDAEVAAVRGFPRSTQSLHELGQLFGMHFSTVARILKGESRRLS